MTTAIETEYAGHRFRSRLEARWAVFFDKLGVKWLYEPQGYELGNGERYLPDFWLPDMYNSCWVEVKGSPSEADMIKLHAATAADGLPLSYEVGARPVDALEPQQLGALAETIPRILLLGDLPRVRSGVPFRQWMTVLTAAGPALQQAFWWVQLDLVGRCHSWRTLDDFTGSEAPNVAYDEAVEDAVGAARKARFEHGESGYLTPALRNSWPEPARPRKEA